MQVFVDQDKCCGSGQCVMLAPDVFDQRDEDGIVQLIDSRPPEQHQPTVREAEQMCPASAISVSDAE